MKNFLVYSTLVFINLPEMKEKSPWCPFETYHMYDSLISTQVTN